MKKKREKKTGKWMRKTRKIMRKHRSIIRDRDAHLLALGEVVVVGCGVWGGAKAKLLPEEQHVSGALHLGQPSDLLQLPLVLKDEGVSSGSPSMEIFLSTHISRASVQDSPLPPLQACQKTHPQSVQPRARAGTRGCGHSTRLGCIGQEETVEHNRLHMKRAGHGSLTSKVMIMPLLSWVKVKMMFL